MPRAVADYVVLMGIGGLLIFLGLVAIIWGWIEAKGYYDSLSGRTDVREHLEHWPPHSKSGTLKAELVTSMIARYWIILPQE